MAQANLIFGKTYEGDLESARKMAHIFCFDLVKALTGKRAMFTTKIVAAMREAVKAPKEIYYRLGWHELKEDFKSQGRGAFAHLVAKGR